MDHQSLPLFCATLEKTFLDSYILALSVSMKDLPTEWQKIEQIIGKR
jgi:hypothetical protein